MPTLLAIDTSTAYLSLALQYNGQIYAAHLEAGHRQAELILPHIQVLLKQANIGIADLAGIVYAQGAGAFTGLRIGLGVAQGLATPFNTPLIGVPCLDAVAYQVPDVECVLAATDARMGEVFYAWFNTQNHQRLSDYAVGKASDIRLPENFFGTSVYGIGNAFMLPEMSHFSGCTNMPTAVDYLALGQTGRYSQTDAIHAELLYVRDKIALTAAEQMARKIQTA